MLVVLGLLLRASMSQATRADAAALDADLLQPRLVDRKWLAADRGGGLGLAEAYGHVGPALGGSRLLLIGDTERPPFAYLLAGEGAFWLVVPPGTHAAQLQGDLSGENGLAVLPRRFFASGLAPFAAANPLSWRVTALSDAQGSAYRFAGWSAGMVAYTPNLEVGLSARAAGVAALFGLKGGASLFWGGGQLATLDGAGQLRHGQSAGYAAAFALVEARPLPRGTVRAWADLADMVESLGAPGDRQILLGRGGLDLSAGHFVVGVEGRMFWAGRAPTEAPVAMAAGRPAWIALSTVGYSR